MQAAAGLCWGWGQCAAAWSGHHRLGGLMGMRMIMQGTGSAQGSRYASREGRPCGDRLPTDHVSRSPGAITAPGGQRTGSPACYVGEGLIAIKP